VSLSCSIGGAEAVERVWRWDGTGNASDGIGEAGTERSASDFKKGDGTRAGSEEASKKAGSSGGG